VTATVKDRAVLRRLAGGAGASAAGDVSPLIRRGARVILLMLWVLGGVAAAAIAWLLLHHAKVHTAATAVSLEQFARRSLTLAAFVVDEYEEFLDQRGGVQGAGDDPRNAEKLATLLAWLPEGSIIGLALPDGRWATSTVAPPGAAPPVNDRRWFKAHVSEGLDAYVGPAILSRLSKRYVFTYTAAYRDRDRGLLGIINLGIPSGAITGLAPDQRLTRTALVQHEGFLVAALPFRPEMIDRPFLLPGPPPDVSWTGFGSLFGAWSVSAVRNIPELRLYAVAAVPVAEVLAPLLWGLAIGIPLLLLLTQLLLSLSGQLQEKSRQVEQALADNKVLFQEVHHRVKNNLQVISSLLRLQTERLPPELRPLLDETGARVRAIALVHEQIYRAASPSDVQLDLFIAQLVQQLSASMIGGNAAITTDLQPVAIGLDRAVPVAILATEAITNAIKHGLDAGDGAIRVSLERHDGRNLLTVRDSGQGMAEQGRPGGLGTRIMDALSRQIDGAWRLAPAPGGGTVFSLDWPA